MTGDDLIEVREDGQVAFGIAGDQRSLFPLPAEPTRAAGRAAEGELLARLAAEACAAETEAGRAGDVATVRAAGRIVASLERQARERGWRP